METEKVSDSKLALQKETLELTSEDAEVLIDKEKLRLSEEFSYYLESYLEADLEKTFGAKLKQFNEKIQRLSDLDKKMLGFQQKGDLSPEEKEELNGLEKTKEERAKSISKSRDIIKDIECSKAKKKEEIEKVFNCSCIEFIKITKENRDAFKKKIESNSREDKRFFYVINGTDGKNSHWFLVVQDKTKIYIIDSLGLQRMEFIDTLIPEVNGFELYKSGSLLQYSSGVCEMYAIKLAFYILRSQIFNDVNKRFQGILVGIKKKVGRLDKVFEAGLDEVAFGRFETIVNRVYILEKQKKLLEEQKPLRYGFKKSETKGGIVEEVFFNKKLIEDLTRSIRMFDDFKQANETDIIKILSEKYNSLVCDETTQQKLINELGINESDYLNIVKLLKKLITENKKTFEVTLQELLRMGTITKSSFMNVTKKIKEQKFNEYLKKKLNISFDQFEVIFDTFEKIKNSRCVCLELNEKGIVDFFNKNTSLRAGHMYWSMLEVTKELKEHIKENTEQRLPEL